MSRHTPTEVPIAWEEIGSGSPVLLVMGLGYARWAWDPIVPALAEHHRVITFDNRGIGESGSPPGPYTAAVMAGDALSVLDDAAVDEAAIVGSSLGGMIAQQLAIEHPERVSSLVLLSTTPGGPDAYPMPQVTVDLMSQAAEVPREEALRSFVANALSDAADENLIDRLVARRMESSQSREAWLAQAAAGIGYDGSDRTGSISVPTLIVHGTSDNVVDPRNSRLLSGLIRDSRLVNAPGGHLFFWEDPSACADLILSFLEETA